MRENPHDNRRIQLSWKANYRGLHRITPYQGETNRQNAMDFARQTYDFNSNIRICVSKKENYFATNPITRLIKRRIGSPLRLSTKSTGLARKRPPSRPVLALRRFPGICPILTPPRQEPKNPGTYGPGCAVISTRYGRTDNCPSSKCNPSSTNRLSPSPARGKQWKPKRGKLKACPGKESNLRPVDHEWLRGGLKYCGLTLHLLAATRERD
jgi:hypothetical protein